MLMKWRSGTTFISIWIPGHSGIPGNWPDVAQPSNSLVSSHIVNHFEDVPSYQWRLGDVFINTMWAAPATVKIAGKGHNTQLGVWSLYWSMDVISTYARCICITSKANNICRSCRELKEEKKCYSSIGYIASYVGEDENTLTMSSSSSVLPT